MKCAHCDREIQGGHLGGVIVYFGVVNIHDTRCEANPLGWHEPADDLTPADA